MPRKSKYSQEFRETAVELATKGEKSVAQVAKELGIDKHSLYSWMKTTKPEARPQAGVKAEKKQMSAEEELKELRRKNKQLEQEVEILKKAAAYFAKTLL